MSRANNATELEKLRRNVEELNSRLASLADRVSTLAEQESSAESSEDCGPDATGTQVPQLRFTKDGEPLPGGPFPAPAGANDVKIAWKGGRIAAAWWTRNCRPFARIPVPPDANDVHLEGLSTTPHRTLCKGSSGDDVGRLQEDLLLLGNESVEVTEVFDGSTEAAVCSLQDALGLHPDGVVDSATRDALGTLTTETMIAEMSSLTAEDIQSLVLTAGALLLQEKPPEGPKLKEWRNELRRAYARRLRQEGFTEDEIEKIALDSATGIWGIVKNLWRLYKAFRAFKKAKQDAGPEPPWEE